MATRKKGKARKVRMDRTLPKKLRLAHACLVTRLERTIAGNGRPVNVGKGTARTARTFNSLIEAFHHGIYCGQTAQLLEDSTQFLHDNWNDLSSETRDALEQQVLQVLDNYANNC